MPACMSSEDAGGAQWLPEAAATSGGGGVAAAHPPTLTEFLLAGAQSRMDAIVAGGPHRWGFIALIGWLLWLIAQGE